MRDSAHTLYLEKCFFHTKWARWQRKCMYERIVRTIPLILSEFTVAPSSDFCKIIIGRECRENSFRLHLPRQSVLHDWYWFKATAPKMQGLPKHSAPIHVWIFENVLTSTKPPWYFPRKYTDFFLQSTTGSPSTHNLHTNVACAWLEGFRLRSVQGTTGRGCPAKKISSFTD